MDKPKAGDIGFVFHKTNKLSAIIAWFMKSRYSHTFLVAGELHGMTLVVETSDFEVCINTLDRYLDDVNTRVHILTPKLANEAEREKIVRFASRYIGTVYGYLQLISFAIRRMAWRLGYRLPNFIRQGMVCTAVPIYGYQATSLAPLSTIDPESIDTQDLYEILTESDKFETVLVRD